MAWNQNRYYTHTRREGGRRIREYLGGGDRGQEAARIDAQARQRRLAQAQRDCEQRQALEALDEPLRQLDALVDFWVEVTLLAAGYHRPTVWVARGLKRAWQSPLWTCVQERF